MNEKQTLRQYELLLASVIAARATSFLFSKLLLQSLAPFNLLAVRFLLAFLLLALIFHRQLLRLDRKTFRSGVIVGALFFMTMSFEFHALRQADSSLVSLLENCSILFVPLFEVLLYRKLPDKMTALSILLAMAGVAALALAQGKLTGSFGFGLLSGASYALAILATDRLSHKTENVLGMGIIQVGTIGLLALAFACCFETVRLPQGVAQWSMLLVQVVVCTGFGFTLQPRAQSHVSADRAGLFCAISPAVATILGVVFLHERLGGLRLVGLSLILFSIVLPYVVQRDHLKKQEDKI